MAWTTPHSWSPDEPVTATLFNTHLRDNLNALKSPPTAQYVCNEAADYTTTSITFVAVDSTNMRLSLTTAGGAVMVGFSGSINGTGTTLVDVGVDMLGSGARLAGDDGLIAVASGNTLPSSFVVLITGLAAGTHTFELMWRTIGSNTSTLYAGAGTSGRDLHPRFWAREVS